MYFSRDLWSLFHCEDFWTRNIFELKADLNAHCKERLFRDKRRPKTGIEESGIVTLIMAIRLYSLILTMALCLQKLMVSLSKACCCLSEIIFRMIRPILFSHEKNMLFSGSDISKTDDNPFFKHKEALEVPRMPGDLLGDCTAGGVIYLGITRRSEIGKTIMLNCSPSGPWGTISEGKTSFLGFFL